MKKFQFIPVFIAFCLLITLIIWQIQQANNSYELMLENKTQQLESELLAIAIDYRRKEIGDKEFAKDSVSKTNYLDAVLENSPVLKNLDYSWKIENREPPKDAIKLNTTSVCLSCLLLINIMPEENFETQDANFVMKHTPAQMVDMRGMDAISIEYINIYYKWKDNRNSDYLIPFTFLTILASVFGWMLYLNTKQRKLIKQKNEFVNHLSHQFQTPLSSIKISSNLLLKDDNLDKVELIQIIQRESNRLENHIKTVLHWVKSDTERLTLYKSQIAITDVIEKSLKQMKPVFIKSKTTINFLPPKEEYTINVDKNHFQLMLFNIWDNAIKHNDFGIEITISVKLKNNRVLIVSSDNGKGIKKIPNSIKFKGLGLAYINKLMLKHKGTLELKKRPFGGLTVILNFPYDD